MFEILDEELPGRVKDMSMEQASRLLKAAFDFNHAMIEKLVEYQQ